MILQRLRGLRLPKAYLSLIAACVLMACGGPQPVAEPHIKPDDTLLETPVEHPPEMLSDAARLTIADILEITDRNSLRRFAAYADKSEGFASNFAASKHYTHWSLMRRTGVDPLREIEALFVEKHGVKTVGEEIWYIWPDLAAKPSGDLLPERLSFRDRARLLELVGETGIEKIRAGGAYPGFRTAISQEGRWVYFLHETGEKENE